MKKVWGWVLGVALVVALGFYIIWNNSNSAPVATITAGSGNTAPPTEPTPTTTGQGATPPPTGSGSGSNNNGAGGTGDTGTNNNGGGTSTGAYKDGTYTGPVSDAIYGQLQIVATISGGQLTSVSWPIYPDAPGHTSEVNASALPQLKQEAVTAQSANIDIVSGATQTSQAFQQSLAAALAQAKS